MLATIRMRKDFGNRRERGERRGGWRKLNMEYKESRKAGNNDLLKRTPVDNMHSGWIRGRIPFIECEYSIRVYS